MFHKLYFSSSEEATARIKALTEKAERDCQQHNMEMKELVRLIDHDRKLRDFMKIKSAVREEDPQLTAWKVIFNMVLYLLYAYERSDSWLVLINLNKYRIILKNMYTSVYHLILHSANLYLSSMGQLEQKSYPELIIAILKKNVMTILVS